MQCLSIYVCLALAIEPNANDWGVDGVHRVCSTKWFRVIPHHGQQSLKGNTLAKLRRCVSLHVYRFGTLSKIHFAKCTFEKYTLESLKAVGHCHHTFQNIYLV